MSGKKGKGKGKGAAMRDSPPAFQFDASNSPKGKKAPMVEFDEDASDEGGAIDMSALLRALDPAVFLNELPSDVQTRVRGLKFFQNKFDDLMVKMSEEIAQIRKKYEPELNTLYDKRSKIVSGAEEPKGEELADLVDPKEGEEKKEKSEEKVEKKEDHEPCKGVPKFWLRAIQNHQGLGGWVSEKDEAVLEYLTNVEADMLDYRSGSFALRFHFAENPYFENKVLTKTFTCAVDKYSAEDGDLEKMEGTEIKWKAGKDVTVEERKKKVKKGGRGGQTRTVTQRVPVQSFFNFFKEVDMDGQEEEEDEEEEMTEADQHMEMGVYFLKHVIPQAVRFYSGECMDMDDFPLDMLEGGEGDEDDEGEEHDHESSEEGEEVGKPAGNKKAGKHGGAGKGGPGKEPVECKQQ